MTTPYQRPRLPSQLTYNDLNGVEAVEILTDWFRQLLRSQPWAQPHLTLPMAKISLNIDIDVEMYIGGTVPSASMPDVLTIDGSVVLDNKLTAVVNAAPVAGGSPPDKIREQHNLPIPGPQYGPRETGSHLFLADGPITPPTGRSDNTSLLERIAAQPHVSQPHVSGERSEPDGDSQTARGSSTATGGRQGIVADGYVFASEVVNHSPVEQHIDIARGGIDIDLSGQGKLPGVATVTDVASKRTAGDKSGHEYGSVGAKYDLGPAGLARGGGRGLYGDGRPRLSFGNSNRG